MPSGFDILYEDGPCLAVCKHAGVLTQAPPGIDSLEVQVKAFLRQRGGTAEDVYLGLPHRLDRPASGAMILATDYRTTRRLGQQFERRQVAKGLLGLLPRASPPEAGTWEDFVYKIPGMARAEVVAAGPSERAAGGAPLPRRGRGVVGHLAGDRRWRPDGRTRSASRRPPAAIRCWATRSTARPCRLVRSMKTCGCGPSGCTPAA